MRHMLTTRGEHADGTECAHRTGRAGQPLEEGCTGRIRYVGRCSCGWTGQASTQNYIREQHRYWAIAGGGAR